MSRRSAPFVAPDYIDDPASKDGKKHAKVLLSTLQEDIANFRNEQFPPDILCQIRDMHIYEGNHKSLRLMKLIMVPIDDDL